MTHYLDHAATTPLLPSARRAMAAELERIGNPSSAHAAGRAARRVVEESREVIAAALGVAPVEVIFTSGGTEGDNLAVAGLFRARRYADPRRIRIVTSPIEHHAVHDTVRWLQRREGAIVSWLPVDRDGVIALGALAEALADPADVALVSVLWANNEIGTLQPMAQLAGIARAAGVPMHTDAVQAAGAVPVDLSTVDVDAATITGHKFGGPVGTGALLLRRGVTVEPIGHGGGQERDVRSGTLDVAGIAGFAVAVTELRRERAHRSRRLERLRDRLVAGVRRDVPGVVVTGEGVARLPGLAHFCFPGCAGDLLLMLLDEAGIACSAGSACAAGVTTPNRVLAAIGLPDSLARGAIRCSLGWNSTTADVDAAIAAMGPAVARATRAGALA